MDFVFLGAEEAAGFVSEGEPGSSLSLSGLTLPRAGQGALHCAREGGCPDSWDTGKGQPSEGRAQGHAQAVTLSSRMLLCLLLVTE